MSWLDDFKIAYVQKNQKNLVKLIDTLPQFDTPEEMQEASLLIEQAMQMLQEEKDTLQ